MASSVKINNCAKTGSPAALQARHELKKSIEAANAARLPGTDPVPQVETDDLNENDIRVVASEGDNGTRWARAKEADAIVAEWNAANPDRAEFEKMSREDLLAHINKTAAK